MAKRAYNSSRRAQQAAQTREDVVQAAISLFRELGWAGTTLVAIAETAGVAVETVYKAGGAKAALLRLAMDAAVVGDSAPIPLADRPEYAGFDHGPRDERIARAVELTATVHERSAGVWLAVVEAAAADGEVDRWRLELERGRRSEVVRVLELIVGRPADDETITTVWLLHGPETYLKLVRDEGMSRTQYEAFLMAATRRALSR